MSSSPNPQPTSSAPRRSQREKKSTKPFTSGKRKRHDEDDEAPGMTEPEDVQALGEYDAGDADVDGEQEDYHAPKPKMTRKAKSKTTPKAKGPPPAKKPRVAKATGSKPAKTTVRRGRKPKEGEDAYDAAQVAKDTKIAADNPLFNAVMNPAAALQSTAEDFLESLEQSPGAAQAELINLILRSCGCNDSVDADEVLDYDGVVDALDTFTEGLKQDNSPVYPLTSKLPIFKKFRRGLSEFLERLIASSAELGALYTSDLMPTLQTWVIAMSSSQIRSFRHTATVVALEVETALCDVAAAVEKEAEVVGRQREGEKKRKASNKAGGARDKELEAKAQEIRERRTKLAEFLKEFVDGVFVHRYRDLDPTIRAECVRAIGAWFKKYPGHFLDASYLRYVGWVLSDSTTPVRVEAVKSLYGVYAQTDYIGSLNHFTERFKPRLIEMATGDTELAVRIAVIQVLSAIDGHSLLEDEEREKMCLLVFDEEPKVRRAVSGFVRGVWEERVEERLAGRGKPGEEDKQRAGVKALAMLLVKWGRVLDGLAGEPEDSEIGDDEEDGDVDIGAELPSRPGKKKRKEVAALVDAEHKGRTALAVEALWEEVECVRDWESLLDVLLLDHSAAEGSEGKRGRANGKARKRREEEVDEAWRLEEVEESVLLQVLVAALRRAKAEVAGSKKGEEENVSNDITRELIKGLPRLFIKHQTDQNRIADILVMPTLMNLDLYLEIRMIAAYASLWDDVTKQFLSHSSLNVLTHAMAAIRHFMDATSLSNTNSSKILELEDELSSALRDTVGGRDEIEVASFTEDEVLSLSALCMRLAVLTGARNMTAWIEEDEGRKQSSAWDIVSAIVERGRLGYKEEETMIEQALHVLTLHIMWKGRESTMNEPEPTPEEIRHRDSLVTQRESLLEKLVEYAVGTQSNTVDGVKRAAFKHLLDLHVLFATPESHEGAPLPTSSVSLSLDDEVQYRCAGYIQAEIERYAESLGSVAADGEEEGEKDSDAEESSGGEQANTKRTSHEKGKKVLREVDTSSRARLEEEYLFMDVMSTFLRAIRAGAIHIRHGATLLAHYARLGPAFDICSKVIVDVLRDEGMFNNKGEVVVSVLTQALEEAYTLVLDGIVHDETNAVQLSKLLATCFVIRGTQLSIVRRLESQYIVQIHTNMLSWIAERLAAYESSKNKRSSKSAAAFFKVLVPLLGTIQSRDALKVKAHMDQVLAQSKVEVSPTSKIWEGQRVYEKRLTAAMSKDKPGLAKKRAKKGDKGVAGMTSGEEGSDGEGLTADEHEPPVRPRRSGLRTRTTEPQSDVDQAIDEDEAGPITPKARPRPKPRPIHKTGSTNESSAPEAHEAAPENSPLSHPHPQLEVNGFETPKPTRKRARPDDEEHEQQSATLDGEDAADDAEHLSDLLTPPGDDIQFRRKRVRH